MAAIAGTHLPRPILAELLPSTALPDHQVVIIDRGRKLGHKAPERRLEMFDPTADPRQMRADGTAR